MEGRKEVKRNVTAVHFQRRFENLYKRSTWCMERKEIYIYIYIYTRILKINSIIFFSSLCGIFWCSFGTKMLCYLCKVLKWLTVSVIFIDFYFMRQYKYVTLLQIRWNQQIES